MAQDYDNNLTVRGTNTTTECAEVTIRNNHSQLSKQTQEKTHSLKFNYSWKKITETILLISIFTIVWCVFAIPTVLYAISASQSSHVQVRCVCILHCKITINQ
jgi:hypothetical protein